MFFNAAGLHGEGPNHLLVRIDHAKISDDFERAILHLGDVHVQPKVVLPPHHLCRSTGAFCNP